MGNDTHSDKLQVIPADWLKPGWLFALKKAGCEVTRFDAPRGDPLRFSQSVLARLEAIRQMPEVIGAFLSSDDCALLSEYFPEHFHKTE